MTNPIISRYKELFRKELTPLGFRLYKKTFYRPINDVVQTVMLVKTTTEFSVEVNIYPLCLPVTDLYCEGYDLASLAKRGGDWECWNLMEEGEEALEEDFKEILELFRQYVKPAFERGVDSKTAYEELIKWERMIYTGIPGGVVMHNFKFVCLCVKSHDYERALLHLAAIIKQNIGAESFDRYAAQLEKGGDFCYEDFIPRFHERPEFRQKMILEDMESFNKLSASDYSDFNQMIIQNEAISRKYLKDPHGHRKLQLQEEQKNGE